MKDGTVNILIIDDFFNPLVDAFGCKFICHIFRNCQFGQRKTKFPFCFITKAITKNATRLGNQEPRIIKGKKGISILMIS
jgi:hypothetical protein